MNFYDFVKSEKLNKLLFILAVCLSVFFSDQLKASIADSCYPDYPDDH
jgi:hypothetical protein